MTDDDMTPVALPQLELVRLAAGYSLMRLGIPSDQLEEFIERSDKWLRDHHYRLEPVEFFCQDPRLQHLIRLLHFLQFAGVDAPQLLATLRPKR